MVFFFFVNKNKSRKTFNRLTTLMHLNVLGVIGFVVAHITMLTDIQ